jgi:hypothetical protein
MELHMITILTSIAGLIVGGIFGFGFGSIQNAAQRRHQKRQESGTFKSGWAIMPGSMSRVALFIIMLALIQLVCPMLFEGASQWLVSAGVVIGYGWTLLSQHREQAAYRA